jgi:glutamate formiminotransferase/formiminotetrahydrofolate cyclodeaminase
VAKSMAQTGNPNSVSDAGVGALCTRAAVMGAFMNVKINAAGLSDKAFVNDILAKGRTLEERTKQIEEEIIKIVNDKIEG